MLDLIFLNGVVIWRFPNTLGVIFDAGMTQIAWRSRLVGSARCADRTPQRGVPTVVLTRIDFERLTNDVISSETKHILAVCGAHRSRFNPRFFASLRMT
jgi:hypothetical protein